MPRLTSGQQAVLTSFKEFGRPMDDVALSVYVHHVADISMSSSGVRSRRAELVRAGMLEVVGTKRAHSGRMTAVHGLTKAGKAALRAQKSAAAVV